MQRTIAAPSEHTTVKGFRTTEDIQRVIKRMASLEEVTESELLTRMVNEYLAARSPAYASVFPEARRVCDAGPDEIEDALAALRNVLASVLGGRPIPRTPVRQSATERLARMQGAHAQHR